LADVLPLTHQAAAAANAARLPDRLEQSLGQAEGLEVELFERDQLLAELLGIVRIAFAFALAGAAVEFIVDRIGLVGHPHTGHSRGHAACDCYNSAATAPGS